MVPDALTDGPRFAAFCEVYVRQTKGRWGGRPLLLEEWQREFWWEALEKDPTTGLRIYQEVGLGIPTKNGKSTQLAAAGYYFLIADGENEPEVLVGAAARHQAGIVLGQARSMGLRSPNLARLVSVQQARILCPRNDGVMRAVASDGVLQHGPNPSCNLIDEIHAHRDAGLYNALSKSGAARAQPITFWISTAGTDPGGVLAGLYGQMLDGGGELERRGDSLMVYRDRTNGVLIYWYGAPVAADVNDPAVWIACNPASWLRDGRFLEREHARLAARGELDAWRMYHLNQLADTIASTWLPDGAWAACADEEVALDPALPVGVGVYKLPDSSAAAIVTAQRQGELVIVREHLFGPEANGRASTVAMREHLRGLRMTYPRAQAMEARNRRPIPGPAIAFERWQFTESAGELDTEGLNMVEFPQTATLMGPASTLTFELATTTRLRHTGAAVLAAQVERTQALLTDRGMKVQPRRDGPPNHAAIALVMAVSMAMQETPPPPKPRVYGSF
jgi:phage terminase large subunit-like protein